MRRILILVLAATLLATPARAIEAPAAQQHVGNDQVLRGSFSEEHPVKGFAQPMVSTGTFVLNPAQGLLWIIHKPMATTTIITQNQSVQDIGGIAIKLPIRNLQYLYNIVSSALAANWGALEPDFTVRNGTSNGPGKWELMLTAKPGTTGKMPYQTITVTGSQYIETIALITADGSYVKLAFSGVTASPMPLAPQEKAEFNIVRQAN